MSSRALFLISTIIAGVVIANTASWLLLSPKRVFSQPQIGEHIVADQSKPAKPKSQHQPKGDKPAAVSKEQIDKLASAHTNFAFKLFSEIVKQKENENILISPFSIHVALAMTYNGAAGKTAEAMAKALELEGFGLDEVNSANKLLKALFEKPKPQVEVKVANSLWARKGIEFKQDFMRRSRNFYDAEISVLDFNDPKSVKIINDWVSKKTNEKIKEILEKGQPIASGVILYLINAVYFKGKWKFKFDEKLTKEGEFTKIDSTKKKVLMMKQKGSYKYLECSPEYSYCENTSFQATSLPYGNGRYEMYIFLPKNVDGIKDFYQKLTAKNWQAWLSNFELTEGTIILPRFKLELKYEEEMKEALTALGMGIAFDNRSADFTGMIEGEGAFINRVRHKTFVEVNEEGTEATAATSVEMMITAVMPSFYMLVDHPFFFAIFDDETKEILFMGSVLEPK